MNTIISYDIAVDKLFGIMPSVVGFLGYLYLNRELEGIQSKKLAMNSTAFIHAAYTSILGYFKNIPLIRLNSRGYFLFDMYYLLINRKLDLLRGMYLYHHCASLYYISLSPIKHYWLSSLTCGEFSNLPNYIVYYYLKKKEQLALTMKNSDNSVINLKPYDRRINFWKRYQAISYTIIRWGFGSYYFYKEITIGGEFNMDRFKTMLPVIPVYFMGLLWSGFMVKDTLKLKDK
tara:strand:- start:380 stop:1075 length:696 start_codon:yes stop_codon:yes gene_type:complete